jgi:uncharacterized damage-inducible protein DinB
MKRKTTMTNLIQLEAIPALLQATPELLRTLLAALPAGAAQWRPAAGEWCINEVLGHMIEGERRGFAGRIQHILAEEQHICHTWEPDQVAQARADCAKGIGELLQEFTQLREASLGLVTGLQPAQLTKQGQHPKVGALSVSDLLYEWVYHDLNHFKQIESNVMALLWPQMANAQRFYQG